MPTLMQANIELIDESRLLYRCLDCGQTWSTNLLHGGRRPAGWWRCPNGCNAE